MGCSQATCVTRCVGVARSCLPFNKALISQADSTQSQYCVTNVVVGKAEPRPDSTARMETSQKLQRLSRIRHVNKSLPIVRWSLTPSRVGLASLSIAHHHCTTL